MPIYAYQCEACGHELEVLQKISEEPLRDCPECGREALRKQVTAAAFRLKGTGWYETDFKGGNKADGGDKASDKASKDSAKDKPAAATESTATSSAAKGGDS